jgi:SPX domain protein involved in polyphosphate accumulation
MAIEVFNRYEMKYKLNNEVYHRLIPKLLNYMEEDAHSEGNEFYKICNVYYDTTDNYLIRKSIEKPIYKEKLRLRCYGEVGMDDRIFIEIKKKYNGIVNKRRTVLTLAEAYQFLETKQIPKYKPYMNAQVINEVHYLINSFSLVPSLYLSYDRCAMFGKADKDFRITFDKNILTRRYDMGLEYGSYGEPLLETGTWLMELKINKATPLWLSEILSECKIYPASFSKYGTEYMRYIG